MNTLDVHACFIPSVEKDIKKKKVESDKTKENKQWGKRLARYINRKSYSITCFNCLSLASSSLTQTIIFLHKQHKDFGYSINTLANISRQLCCKAQFVFALLVLSDFSGFLSMLFPPTHNGH